jgi:hypothetical protein
MRVGLDADNRLCVADFRPPRLTEAHVEALISGEAVDHRRFFSAQRDMVGLVGNRQTGVIGDVLAQGQLLR